MIFLSIKIFVFLMLCAVGCVAGVGIYTYMLFMAAGSKATAEIIFFISVCVVLVLSAGFLSAITYSKRKRRELNRITKMARVNGVIAAERFSKFGRFGIQLQSLFEDILRVSEMRSVRIAYLNNAVSVVCNHTPLPMLIVDITGTIQYVSNGYIKKISDEEKSIVGMHLLDVYSEINFEEVLSKIEKSGSEYTVKTEKLVFNFLPIFSKENLPAGVLVTIEKSSLLSQGSSAVKQLYESVKQKDVEADETLNERGESTDTSRITDRKPDFFDSMKKRFFNMFGQNNG